MFSLIAVLCLVKKPILRDSLQCSSFFPTLGYFFSFQFQISPLSMYKFTNDRVTPYIFKCIDTSLWVNRHSEIFTLARLSVVFKLACLDGRWKRNEHSWLIKSILMWFELVHSCGLRVVFEWLHGSDLGSYVVQTGSIGIVITHVWSIFGFTGLIVHMHSSNVFFILLDWKVKKRPKWYKQKWKHNCLGIN